jgi:hypothetical protein
MTSSFYPGASLPSRTPVELKLETNIQKMYDFSNEST